MVFRVVEPLDAGPELPPIVIVAALIKFDRFEWMIEKVTELGVKAVVPVEAARSEAGLFKAAVKRVERWRKIARESSQQARRVRVPEIRDAIRLAEALRQPIRLRRSRSKKIPDRRDCWKLLQAWDRAVGPGRVHRPRRRLDRSRAHGNEGSRLVVGVARTHGAARGNRGHCSSSGVESGLGTESAWDSPWWRRRFRLRLLNFSQLLTRAARYVRGAKPEYSYKTLRTSRSR